MAAEKIEFEDKVLSKESDLPVIETLRFQDINEVKLVVNAHADDIDALQTGGLGVQTVTGDGVAGTTQNPIMEFPDTSEVDETTNKKYVTDAEKIVLSNTSNTNTGDETTGTIQVKRPIKTVNGNSLEGVGNIVVEGVCNVFETNELTFVNNVADYFGKYATPRTGALTSDLTGAITGAITVVYYNNATLDLDFTPTKTFGDDFEPSVLMKLFFERDVDGNIFLNIVDLS